MALMLGQLYDALRAGNVPDDKARAAAEEVANYEGEIAKLRVEVGEIRSDVRLLKWMMGFVLAFQVANFFLQFR
jgi:phage shock protein A